MVCAGSRLKPLFKHDIYRSHALLPLLCKGFTVFRRCALYRADGWYNTTEYTTSRPDKVSTPTVVVDENWWGEYNYRGFNIEEADGKVADENTATHLRIYVPKK